MNKKISVSTDTATIVVFDLAAIKHRITDAPDWWSILEDEIFEMNAGNIAFFGMGQDGNFTINIVSDIGFDFGSLFVDFPSGQLFIGAGEDTTGGGLEPDFSEAIQGDIINLSSGFYLVKYKRVADCLELAFLPSKQKINYFNDPIKL